MQIKIRKSIAEDIGLSKFTRFVEKDSWGWKEEVYLDLASMDRDNIDYLRQILAERDDIRGTATAVRDIDTWLLALHDPDATASAKPRSPRQLEPLLIRLIGRVPGHRIYDKVDEMEDVWRAHYVSRIEYHERVHHSNGGSTPEHVTANLHWEEFQGSDSRTVIFWPDDVRGYTVVEALARKGYYVETPSLRKKYLAEMRRWSALIKQIGKQCLAYGTATDEPDGNTGRRDHWYYRSTHVYKMAKKDGPTKVLVDVFKESDDKDKNSDRDIPYKYFWTLKDHTDIINQESKRLGRKRKLDKDDHEDLLEDLDVPTPEIEIPIHPYLAVFDLKKHLRLKIHVAFLADYRYDKGIIDRLILPSEMKDLVRMLIEHEEAKFQDIVEGKSGGAVVLLTGRPGVGKTLTAEVYAESEERGLYSVQCSQLGTDPDKLEEELLKVFTRAQRWGAVLLLDEADVYVRERGADLHQNAIVGVFLRVLEYQGNVLFLTTNRPEDVDDAIASRCVARLNYKPPTDEDQARIWRVLADAFKIELPDEEIGWIVSNSSGISGRDVKNLLKLAALVAKGRGCKVDSNIIEFCKKFKPTQ
jgi:hypothetical protein